MLAQGSVALITGGSSGIGLGTAKILAQHGAKLAILGRHEAKLMRAAQELREQGAEVMPVVADVANAAQIEQAVNDIFSFWNRLDIVFANAGVNGVWAPIEQLEPDEWDQTIKINLGGTFHTVRAAVPIMKKTGGGSIIITSSVNGTRMFSNTGATAYACSKAAQVAFAKMTALELAPHKIRVNVICPGWIESDIDDNTEKRNIDEINQNVEFPNGTVPLKNGGPGQAEEVGKVVLFLASDQSSHVTGSELWVDGAQSLLQG